MENAVSFLMCLDNSWPPESAGPLALASLLRPLHIIRQQGNVELCEPELPATSSSSEPSSRLREMENAVNFLKCLNNSWPPESAGPLARPPLNAEMYLQ